MTAFSVPSEPAAGRAPGHDGNVWGQAAAVPSGIGVLDSLNEVSYSSPAGFDHPAALQPQKTCFPATDKQETHKEASCGRRGGEHAVKHSPLVHQDQGSTLRTISSGL